jgi:hypothetical protein
LVRLADSIGVPIFFHDNDALPVAKLFYDKHLNSLCGCEGDEEYGKPCGCTVLITKDEAP